MVLPHLLTTTALQMTLSGITDGICSSLKVQACKGKGGWSGLGSPIGSTEKCKLIVTTETLFCVICSESWILNSWETNEYWTAWNVIFSAACPPGYVQNEQSCYRPIPRNIEVWDWKSNQTCARSHWQDVAHHVTITSLSEHSFVVGLAIASRYALCVRGWYECIYTMHVYRVHTRLSNPG